LQVCGERPRTGGEVAAELSRGGRWKEGTRASRTRVPGVGRWKASTYRLSLNPNACPVLGAGKARGGFSGAYGRSGVAGAASFSACADSVTMAKPTAGQRVAGLGTEGRSEKRVPGTSGLTKVGSTIGIGSEPTECGCESVQA